MSAARGNRLAHVIQSQWSSRNAEVANGQLASGIPGIHDCNSAKQDNGLLQKSNQFHKKQETLPFFVTTRKIKDMRCVD